MKIQVIQTGRRKRLFRIRYAQHQALMIDVSVWQKNTVTLRLLDLRIYIHRMV